MSGIQFECFILIVFSSGSPYAKLCYALAWLVIGSSRRFALQYIYQLAKRGRS
jgi:hypothetical protein